MSFSAIDGDHYSKTSEFTQIFTRSILTNYINPLKKNYDKILDLGCGTGDNIKFIKDFFNGDKIIGVDKTKSFIDYAKQNNKFSDDVNYEMCDLDGKDGLESIFKRNPDIDLVVSTYVLHWVKIPGDMFNTISSCLPPPVEHVHLIPIVKHELHSEIAENLIKEIKWNKYFQDIGLFLKYVHEVSSKFQTDNFLNAISELKYNILVKKYVDMAYTFETIQSRIESLKWMSPYVQYILKDLQEEFLCELLQKSKENNPHNEYDEVLLENNTYILHIQSK